MLASDAHGGAAPHLSNREGSSTEDMGVAIRYSTENCGLAVEMVDGEE